MMGYSFLAPKFHLYVLLTLVSLFLFSSYLFFFIVLGLYTLIFFLYRRGHSYFEQNKKSSALFSPIKGRLAKIFRIENHIYFLCSQGFVRGWSVFSPCTFRVTKITRYKGRKNLIRLTKMNRIKKNRRVEIEGISPNGKIIKVIFFPSLWDKNIRYFMQPGDNVLSGARIGYIPFAGKVAVVVEDQGFDIIKDAKIISNQTILIDKGYA